MQNQDIKRGHFKNIEGDKLRQLMVEMFGTDVEVSGDRYIIHCGALDPLVVRVESPSKLVVDTTMKTDVDTAVAADTIKRYNTFLERATGFTSKQRRKRLNDKAKKGLL